MDEYGLRIPAESDEWRKSPSRKKDTKRWCRGHEGREHVPEIRLQKWPYAQNHACRPAPEPRPGWVNQDQHDYICYHEVVCANCSKRLAWAPERCPLNQT